MKKRYLLIDDVLGAASGDSRPPGRRHTPNRPLIVTGRSAGGPDQLAGQVVDVLIDCERAGAATLLLAGTVDDLTTPVAAVCRYVAADQPDVVEEAGGLFGTDRVLAVESARVDDVGTWIGSLLETPVRSNGLRRRFVSLAERVGVSRRGYGKIRGRNNRSERPRE